MHTLFHSTAQAPRLKINVRGHNFLVEASCSEIVWCVGQKSRKTASNIQRVPPSNCHNTSQRLSDPKTRPFVDGKDKRSR